tara:strand:+ start:166 stop:357 length:192 start_codon:yes stop_codon:yes gene_type:complete
MTLNDLKKELRTLLETEERLLEFLIQHPEHTKEAVEKIFEVSSLILQMRNIIEEMKKQSKSDD